MANVPYQKIGAGRELDAILDEKVFGFNICWTEMYSDATPFPLRGLSHLCETSDRHNPILRIRVPNDYCNVPFYSTDIAAAWQIIEKLVTGTTYECYLTHQFNGWSCLFDAPDKPEGYAEGLPAPLAISLAALKASEV